MVNGSLLKVVPTLIYVVAVILNCNENITIILYLRGDKLSNTYINKNITPIQIAKII